MNYRGTAFHWSKQTVSRAVAVTRVTLVSMQCPRQKGEIFNLKNNPSVNISSSMRHDKNAWINLPPPNLTVLSVILIDQRGQCGSRFGKLVSTWIIQKSVFYCHIHRIGADSDMSCFTGSAIVVWRPWSKLEVSALLNNIDIFFTLSARVSK